MVDSSRVLRIFSKEPAQARKLYGEFLEQAQNGGKEERLFRGMKQQILGGDDFIEEVERRSKKNKNPLKKPSLQAVLSAVSAVTSVTPEEIGSRRRSREIQLARGVLARAWRELGNRLGDLQPKVKRDLSVLSRLSRIAEHADAEKAVTEVLRKLDARLQA
jgi:chromosomal replication initiation ATPase DnaA